MKELTKANIAIIEKAQKLIAKDFSKKYAETVILLKQRWAEESQFEEFIDYINQIDRLMKNSSFYKFEAIGKNFHMTVVMHNVRFCITFRKGRNGTYTLKVKGHLPSIKKLNENQFKAFEGYLERTASVLEADERASRSNERLVKLAKEVNSKGRNGTMAAKKKVAKKKVAAKKAPAKKAKKESKSEGRPVGKTSGVGVQETWIGVFAKNETCKKADRLTDEQISAYMHSEFPSKDSKVFDQVQAVRNKYNKGGFKKVGTPSKQSNRYDADGNVVEVRGGGSGKKSDAAGGAKKATKKVAEKKAPAKSDAAPAEKKQRVVKKNPEAATE